MINVGMTAPPTYEESIACDRCHEATNEENRPNVVTPKEKSVEIPLLFSTTNGT